MRVRVMRIGVTTTACVLTVFCGASTMFGQETTLRYRWVKGDHVRYRINQEIAYRVEGPGIRLRDRLRLSQVIRRTVEDVDADGNATVREVLESMRLESGKSVVDSTADKATDPATAGMRKLTGQSMLFVVTPNGAVVTFGGMNEAQAPAATDEATSSLEQFLGPTFRISTARMTSGLEQNFFTVPPTAVRVGQTWAGQFLTNSSIVAVPLIFATSKGFRFTVPFLEPIPSMMAVDSALKGVKVRNGTSVANIAVSMVTRRDADAAPSDLLGVPTSVASTGSGEILFDVTRGRLLKMSLTSDMSVTWMAPGREGRPVSVRILPRTTLTMDLLDK